MQRAKRKAANRTTMLKCTFVVERIHCEIIGMYLTLFEIFAIFSVLAGILCFILLRILYNYFMSESAVSQVTI
eukprot:m.286341 g.286341  ORF g.286341 m.286341 type:complete len:73 (+) comp40691_c0_seq69:3257-3475(+)